MTSVQKLSKLRERGWREREGDRSRDSQTESGCIACRGYQISGTFLVLEPETLVEISHNNPQLVTEFTLFYKKTKQLQKRFGYVVEMEIRFSVLFLFEQVAHPILGYIKIIFVDMVPQWFGNLEIKSDGSHGILHLQPQHLGNEGRNIRNSRIFSSTE